MCVCGRVCERVRDKVKMWGCSLNWVNLSVCGVCVYTWDGSEGVWQWLRDWKRKGNPTQGAKQWELSHLLPNMGIAWARFPFFPLAFPFPFSFRQFLRKKKENILIWTINYSSNFENQTEISIHFPINDWKYFNYFHELNWNERKEKKLLGSFLSACHFIQCVTWIEWQPWRDGVTNNLNLHIGISPELFYPCIVCCPRSSTLRGGCGSCILNSTPSTHIGKREGT